MRGNVTPSSFLAVHFSTTMRFVVLQSTRTPLPSQVLVPEESVKPAASILCTFSPRVASVVGTQHTRGVTSYFFLFSNSTPLFCTMYAIFSSQQPLLHIGGSSEPNCQSCCVAVLYIAACCCCLRFIQTIKHTGTEVIASLFHPSKQAFTHTHSLSRAGETLKKVPQRKL